MKDGDVQKLSDEAKTERGTLDMQMSPERIKELRERLYARGATPQRAVRHSLQESHQIHDRLEVPPDVKPSVVSLEPKEVKNEPPHTAPPAEQVLPTPMSSFSHTRKRLRKKLLIGGALFFFLALVVSSLSLFFGNNTISGENISIAASGPIAVGAGEEFAFQVAVTNQNTVAVQSPVLIIEYPEGTQSVTEEDKIITTERISLDSIDAGELVNVPIRARIFGEENQEKEIKVSIDYRIVGSNATFHKEAVPLKFKVSTSPVVITFDTIKAVSAGQEFELKLIVQSNAPTPLSNILIKTTYPEGFDFTSAKPDTVSGEDTWKITTLKPSEKQTITIKGLLSGHETESRRFSAIAGVASDEDRNALASQLANAFTNVTIEQAFLDIAMSINGNQSETVVVNVGDDASVEVLYKNSLDATIYDGTVFVELSGNALNEFDVEPTAGFYDSTKNTITWDSVESPALKEVLPGKTVSLKFAIRPKDSVGRAPELTMKTTAKGQRVFENRVPQELIGTASRTMKIESIPTLASQVLHNGGPFTNTGPLPPVAEKTTQYTYTLTVKTGSNDVTGAEVTAVLPSYVRWLDLVSSGDTVSYGPTSRTIKWTIGDIDANSEVSVSMQVSFVPSLSQIGTIPTLLETQRFKATDRFTSTVVRAEAHALTTELPGEPDEDLRDGRVQKDD